MLKTSARLERLVGSKETAKPYASPRKESENPPCPCPKKKGTEVRDAWVPRQAPPKWCKSVGADRI